MKMLKVACFTAALVLSGNLALAQSNVGSITGIITDQAGAVVPGADVTITNRDTGVVNRARSNDEGVYGVPSLIPGRYGVEIQAPGFGSKQVEDLTVESTQKVRLDMTLEAGGVAEQVIVAGGTPLLMKETAEVSETITSTEIRNLPLNSRAPYGLLSLSAGVSATGNDPSDLDYAGGSSINGSRVGSTAFVVDGASTVHIGGIGERIGSVEAIQEFKVLSSTYSAEYGRTSGGVVAFQVKSGTQEYHGSLYEFHRNSVFSANSWENNARGVARPRLLRNEFGFSVGGPVPKTGKKLFFFFSYEGLRDSIPLTRTRTIPDLKVRTGDFSGLPVTITDPLTNRPFPNNVIPANRLDPAAVRTLALFPAPNSAGSASQFGIVTGNFIRPGAENDNKNFYVGRVDYNLNDRNRFFFTYSWINEGPRDLGIDFDNVLNTTIGPRFRNIQRGTFGYTRLFSPNLTNEFLLFGQRDPRLITPWFPDFNVATELGIRRSVGTSLPQITISGGYGNFGNSQYENWIHQPVGTSNITTYLRGRHTMRFGAQLYQNQFWYESAGNTSGNYTFVGEITGGAAGRNNPLNPLADFLLGAVKTAQIPVTQIPVNRFNYNLGLFFNDDWKVTNQLTLNLGLRYEFETNQAIKNNVYSRIDLTTGNLLVAGRNATRNLDLKNDYLNFSPRLGLSYALGDETVIRSGFGIFHSNIWANNGSFATFPGFTGTQSYVDLGLGRAQNFTYVQGFPVEEVPPFSDPLVLFRDASVARPLAVPSATYNANDSIPYIMQWNLSAQRNVGFNTVLDVAYVASRSLHLSRNVPVNNPVLARAADAVIRRVPIQQLRPYPNLTAFNAVFYDASANYNSLQIKATRRFSGGLSIDGNYTFSKNIDTASGTADSFQLPRERADLERALSSLDRPHIFSVGSVYQIPVGTGRRFLNGGGVLAAILGGFQINGILSASSGLPLTITQTNTNLVLSAQRPDVRDISNLSGQTNETVYVGPARRWLIAPTDPNFPFVASSNVGIGNLGRNTSREPGFWNLNLSLFRAFAITERVRFDFRAEAFNALNHVNYLEPASTNINNANYGLIIAAAPPRRVQFGLRLTY